MDRVDRFKGLKNHPWFGKSYSKLNKSEVEFAIKWLMDKNGLSKNEIAHQALRIWLDKMEKPKNWPRIEELLIAVISLD